MLAHVGIMSGHDTLSKNVIKNVIVVSLGSSAMLWLGTAMLGMCLCKLRPCWAMLCHAGAMPWHAGTVPGHTGPRLGPAGAQNSKTYNSGQFCLLGHPFIMHGRVGAVAGHAGTMLGHIRTTPLTLSSRHVAAVSIRFSALLGPCSRTVYAGTVQGHTLDFFKGATLVIFGFFAMLGRGWAYWHHAGLTFLTFTDSIIVVSFGSLAIVLLTLP